MPGKDAYTVYAAHRNQLGIDTNDSPGQETDLASGIFDSVLQGVSIIELLDEGFELLN